MFGNGFVEYYSDGDLVTLQQVQIQLASIAPGSGSPYTTDVAGGVHYGRIIVDEDQDTFPWIGYHLLTSSLENIDDANSSLREELFDLIVEAHIRPNAGSLMADAHNIRKDVVNAICNMPRTKGVRAVQYNGFDTTSRQFGSKVTSLALEFEVAIKRCI